jgi:serine/threonine-protein kinase
MPSTADLLKAALADRYRVERELGHGGMATVYLAHDFRHDRPVALKVLRPELAAVIGAERFLKEIKVTANLQHPHILGLIDSGEVDALLYYVMPFVEGESLREKLTREKNLAIADAVRITTEVGSALDYAHRHHVIHRDIKPENILLHDGQALVADFGIALAVSAAGGTRMTETGLSLGTPHYMSPEQALGEREITARSDVYALGCVLYEMLVGEPPFTGPTAQAVVARVVTELPRSLTAQRHTIPPEVEAAVFQSLEKLPADRFPSAAAFSAALGDPSFRRGGVAPLKPTGPGERPWVRRPALVAAIAVLGIAALGALLLSRGRGPSATRVFRMDVALPSGQRVRDYFPVVLSPDRSYLAYMSDGDALMLKAADEPEGRTLLGVGDPWKPIFSPDGRKLSYLHGTPGDLRVIGLPSGTPQTVVSDSVLFNGGWGESGMLYFTAASGRVMRVGSDGSMESLASPDPRLGERLLINQTPLPGERALIAVVPRGRGESDVVTIDLRSGARNTLGAGDWAYYLPTGHVLLVGGDGSVKAARLDLKRLRLAGPVKEVLPAVAIGDGAPHLSIAQDGTLLYLPARSHDARVVRVGRNGTAAQLDPEWQGDFRHLSLSPDGSRLALTVGGGGQLETWVKVLDHGPFTRVGVDGYVAYRPGWSPDGRSITYISDARGSNSLVTRRADGSGETETLLTVPRGVDEGFWSRDGRWLVVRIGVGGHRDIYALRVGTDSAPVAIVATDDEETCPALSPDGKWLAYVSDASGRREVYVSPFPAAGSARWQVSLDGGNEPVWSHSGRELFFLSRGQLMSVALAPSDRFRASAPEPLFPVGDYWQDGLHPSYAVGADDQSFLFVRREEGPAHRLVMVLNWFDELKAKVP